MSNKNIGMIIIPREYYPNKRVNLRWLYEEELVKKNYNIHWIYNTTVAKSNTFSKKRNHYYINSVKSNIGNNLIDYIFSLPYKYKKVKELLEKDDTIRIIHVRDGIFEALLSYYFAKKHNILFSFHLSSFFHFFYLEKLNIEKDKLLYVNFFKRIYYYLFYKIHPIFLSFILPRCDLFNAVSDSMEKKLSGEFKLKSILTTPLCGSNQIKIKQKKTVSKYGKYIIASGQIIEEKGVEFIIKSFAFYKKEYKDKSLNLVLVGPIQRPIYKIKLLELIDSLKLKNSVYILGNLNFKAYFSILSKSQIGLSLYPNVSSYYYCSPTKCIDYMMAGIPVIGNKEVRDQFSMLKKSNSGILVSHDKKLIGKCINFLINNNSLRKKMGSNGKAWISKNREYSLIANRIDKKYRSLIIQK